MNSNSTDNRSPSNLDIYKALTEIPVFTGAVSTSSRGGFECFRLTSSVVDHERNLKRALTKTLFVSPAYERVHTSFSSDVQEVGSDVLLTRYSESGRKKAVLREVPSDEGGARKRFVEVWRGDHLEVVKDVTKHHGEFYVDDAFASLAFSPSETILIWTAERLKSGSSDNGTSSALDRFRYTPHYGEQFKGRQRPALYLLRWSLNDTGSTLSSQVHTLDINDVDVDEAGFGQAVFSSESTIYCTGYSSLPNRRKLGLRGCTNRPAGIYKLRFYAPSVYSEDHFHEKEDSPTTHAKIERVSSPDRSSRSPRISTVDGANPCLVWISNALGGPHASCSQLHIKWLNTGDEQVLVNTVQEQAFTAPFPGLYLDQLPLQPFISKNQMAVNTVWASRRGVVLVNLMTGEVDYMESLTTIPENPTSLTFLAASPNGSIVFAESSPIQPNWLRLGRQRFKDRDRGAPLKLNDLEYSIVERSLLPSFVTSAISTSGLPSLRSLIVPVGSKNQASVRVETIVIKEIGKKKSDKPCIVVIHGGPHTTSLAEFSPAYVALALAGFTVSLPNYTGSLGFGQRAVEELSGRCGSLDVEECLLSVQELIKRGLATEGPGKLFVMGGSHGGFLALHLVARAPDVFSAAVVRNPVVSIPDLFSTSDIPDWSYEEFGIPYDVAPVLSKEIFERLHNASPLTYVSTIKAPVLLLIGEDDQRVPPSQGKAMYHTLKGMNKETDMFFFPKNSHALDKVEAARVGWLASLEWVQRFGKESGTGTGTSSRQGSTSRHGSSVGSRTGQ